MDTVEDTHNISDGDKWMQLFGRKPFGKCIVCNNQVRATVKISRMLNINNYNNMKYPLVHWKESSPVCYYCNNLGDNINDIINTYNTTTNNNIFYLQNWYKMQGYCYYGSNKFRLCGNKKIHNDGLCEKHYNIENNIVALKKGKFTR